MPHYADGREAQVGDTVVGKGYNVKETITGRVVGIVADQDACNIRVAYIKSYSPVGQGNTGFFAYTHTYGEPMITLDIGLEYGATKDFNKID